MKNLSLILILLTLFSCKKDNSFIIKGKVLNKESGIIRLTQIGEKYYDAELCKLTSGEFNFKGEIGLPEQFFIEYQENESSRGTKRFYFFVEPASEIEIILNLENINKSEFKGSKIGNEYYRLQQETYNDYNSKTEKLIRDYDIAQEENHQEEIDKIVEKLDSISNQVQIRKKSYIWNNPKSYISAYFLHNLQFILKPDTVQKYFNNLDKSLETSKYYKRVNSFISVQVGKPFLDFDLPDSTGLMHSLSSIAKNKVTLIDFWFSSCGPCREHNRHLKQLYEKNKSKGFEVVGISSDKDRSAFIKAINEDGMTWLNLLDRRDEEAVSNIYEANAIPFNVLIDANGIIVYRAYDYKNLEIMVNKLLNNK